MQFRIKDLTPKQLQDVKDQIKEYESKPEYDFSEFVGRWWRGLAIKWDKMLKSYKFGGEGLITIDYNNTFRTNFDDKLSYTERKLSELEYWDLFITVVSAKVIDLNMSYFEYFLWAGKKISTNIYHSQYIRSNDGIEAMDIITRKDTEVIKINRD